MKARFLRGEVNSAVDQPKGCEDPLRRYFVNPKAGRIGYPGVLNLAILKIFQD